MEDLKLEEEKVVVDEVDNNKILLDLDDVEEEILISLDFNVKSKGNIYPVTFQINYDNAIEAASLPQYKKEDQFKKLSSVANECVFSNDVNLTPDTKFKIFVRMCNTEEVQEELNRFQNRAGRRKTKSNTSAKPTI